ncbi:MAG: TCAD7 domain-containing protein, partial [Longimicrobiaceae bacterium]
MPTPVAWSESTKILTVPSKRSLRSVLDRLRREQPDWVVIHRPDEWNPERPYFYALRPSELLDFADEHPDRLDRTLEEALELHEDDQSAVTRGPRPAEVELVNPQSHSPSSMRAVHLDAQGKVVAVGEPPTAGATRGPTRGGMRGGHKSAAPTGPDLGPTRGGTRGGTRGVTRGPSRGRTRGGDERAVGAGGSAPDAAEQVEVTISAQAKEQIPVGAIDLVDFRIELKGEAMPLRHQLDATISTDKKIRVLITVHGTAVEALDPRIQEVDPPAAGEPTLGAFEIRGIELGRAEIALLFRQGGTQLGSIRFSVSVVAAAAAISTKVSGSAVAASRGPANDEVLTLLIEPK